MPLTEPGGWPAVIQTHTNGLYSLALHMLGDRGEAEDVVQDTFLRAFVAVERRGMAVHTSLRAFLSRIAVNLCYDRLRRKGWYETPTGADEIAVASEQVARASGSVYAEDPAELAIDAMDAATLHRAILDLQPNHRAAVVLRYSRGLSYREIADAMDVPENTVATWLRRAHLALRRVLADEIGEEPQHAVR